MNAHQKGNAESGQLKSVSQTIPEDMLKDNMTNIYYNIWEARLKLSGLTKRCKSLQSATQQYLYPWVKQPM